MYFMEYRNLPLVECITFVESHKVIVDSVTPDGMAERTTFEVPQTSWGTSHEEINQDTFDMWQALYNLFAATGTYRVHTERNGCGPNEELAIVYVRVDDATKHLEAA